MHIEPLIPFSLVLQLCFGHRVQLLLLGPQFPNWVLEEARGQAGPDQRGGQTPDGAHLHVHRGQQVGASQLWESLLSLILGQGVGRVLKI